LWLNNTDCLSVFPYAAYELRHSLDLALLTKWPVFLQNAFGNPAYVNQKILKLGKKLGGQTGDQAKIWGDHGPPRPPPIESPLDILTATLKKIHLGIKKCFISPFTKQIIY